MAKSIVLVCGSCQTERSYSYAQSSDALADECMLCGETSGLESVILYCTCYGDPDLTPLYTELCVDRFSCHERYALIARVLALQTVNADTAIAHRDGDCNPFECAYHALEAEQTAADAAAAASAAYAALAPQEQHLAALSVEDQHELRGAKDYLFARGF